MFDLLLANSQQLPQHPVGILDSVKAPGFPIALQRKPMDIILASR